MISLARKTAVEKHFMEVFISLTQNYTCVCKNKNKGGCFSVRASDIRACSIDADVTLLL